MRDGFLRVAASTPEVKVADVQFNREEICRKILREGRTESRLWFFQSCA